MKYLIGFSSFALILMLFGLVDSTANASTQIFTKRLTHTDGRWQQTVAFPKADSARGELVAVVVQLSGNMKGAAQVSMPFTKQSQGGVNDFEIDFDGSVKLLEPTLNSISDLRPERYPAHAVALATVNPKAKIAESVSPVLGRALFKKPSAPAQLEGVGMDNEVIQLTEPSQLQDFLGDGVVHLPLQGVVNAHFTHGNALSAYLNANLITELSIEYIYNAR